MAVTFSWLFFLSFERWGGEREGQGNVRHTCSQKERDTILLITALLLSNRGKRAHVNEVISSFNYEKYTVGRRKVKVKRMWRLEGPGMWSLTFTTD